MDKIADMSDQNSKYAVRKGQSFAGFVRTNLLVLDAERAAGISGQVMVEEIKEAAGYDVNVFNLSTAMSRARRKLKEEAAQRGTGDPKQSAPMPGAAAAPAAQAVPAAPASNADRPRRFSYDPNSEDLTAIFGTSTPGNPVKGNS